MTIRIVFGAAAAALLVAPAVARRAPAHAATARARTVQLISMMAGASPADASDRTGDGGPEMAAAAAPQAGSFALHDLSRRWVEYQMQASLASSPIVAEAGRVRDDDPFAPQVRPGAAGVGDLGSASPASLTVPAWMLERGVAAAPTARFTPGCTAVPYRPSGLLALGSEVRRQAFYGIMSSIACQYGIPVGLFDAMIIRESRYNSAIVSSKNAFGLTQLMPATAAGLGVNRYDIEQNLRGGARYLRQQLDRFGQYHLALAAYNAGPGRVRGTVPAIAETRGYVDNILGNWARLSGLGGSTPAPARTTAPVATPPRSGATLMVF